jgi:hypothetical protein
MTGFVAALLRFLSSFGLACVVLLFLLLLTFLGTLEQVDSGLFDVQKKYFESLFLVHDFFGVVPIPLPGVYLLLTILFLNLMVGGLIRLRKKGSTVGIFIVHTGIGLLLVGEFIRFQYAQDGQMSLWPQEQSNEVESYFEWEVALVGPEADGSRQEYVIPASDFTHLTGGASRLFSHPELPFDLTLSDYARNVDPRPESLAEPGDPVAEGVALHEIEPVTQAEANRPALIVGTELKDGGESRRSVLLGLFWMETNPTFAQITGMHIDPHAVRVGDAVWTIDLRKKRWQVPFEITLDQFIWERHPNTTMAKTFSSDVTKTENGLEETRKISMNEPLRHEGFTFYQASFGPPNTKPTDLHYSTFAVLKNPADRFPIYACIVIGLGMLFHFLQRLMKFLRKESKRTATA